MEGQRHSENGSNDGKSTADAISDAFREMEITLRTDEGHLFGGGPSASGTSGIFILIVPDDDSAPEPGVMDVFSLGLLSSSIQTLLAVLKRGEIYKTGDEFTRIWMENECLNFDFRFHHLPNSWFRSSLGPSSSDDILKWFAYHSRTPRNSLCPCNSGKKFKTCCARWVPQFQEIDKVMKLRGIPTELRWLEEIESDDLKEFIDAAILNPTTLEDSDYWFNLGSLVGTLEHRDRAIECFNRSLALDPQNHTARLNLAATLVDFDEAIALIEQVPESTKRRSVILANTLLSHGDGLEAIPLYERAISEEPEFPLPYQRLLSILRQESHPLYEYWINQAVNALPSSPWIADFYAGNLWAEKRVEELAEAVWIDDVIVEVDFSVIGHPDYSFEATRAGILRRMAVVALNPSQEILENLAVQISGIDAEWHLCDEGKYLSVISANQGLPEFIPRFYDRVCGVCRDGNIGGVPRNVNSLLAIAHLARAEYSEAIAYCEKVLVQEPDSSEILNPYYWALDEIGRTEDAITAAKRMYDIAPDWNYVPYNIGVMSQKIGLFGEARFFYERQLEIEPVFHAEGAITFLNLLDKQFDDADQSCHRWLTMMLDPQIAEDFYLSRPEIENRWIDEGSEATEFDGAISQTDIKALRNNFEELLDFAKANNDTSTFVKDLVEKNQSFEDLKIGPDSTIRPESCSIDQIIGLSIHGDDPAAYQTRFLLTMEKGGDYSAVHASLIEPIPILDLLPWEAKASLLEGERRYMSEANMLDYSTVVVSFAKALEICLLRFVFVPYKSNCEARVTISNEIQIALEDKKSQSTSLIKFLDKDLHLELGTMAHLLRLCNGRTAEKEPLIGRLRDFIKLRLGSVGLLDKGIVSTIESIAKEFRNPGAHSAVLTSKDAEECRRLCIEVLQSLEPSVTRE